MSNSDSEFMKSLSGGTIANMIFAVGFMIYRVFTAKCKHSKCKSKTGCFECSSQEDSILSKDAEDEHKIREEFNQNLSQLLGKLETRLSAKREQIVRSHTLRGNSSRLDRVADESRIEEQV